MQVAEKKTVAKPAKKRKAAVDVDSLGISLVDMQTSLGSRKLGQDLILTGQDQVQVLSGACCAQSALLVGLLLFMSRCRCCK